MSDNPNLFASTEIVGAMATNAIDTDTLKAFSANPQNVIASELNVDTSAIDIQVVENKNNDVNLVLPYYSELDVIQSKSLEDANLDNVSGGEIFITIGTLIGVTVGTTVVAAGMAITGGVVGGIVGGAIGGVVVAGAVAGGVVGGIKHDEAVDRGEK